MGTTNSNSNSPSFTLVFPLKILFFSHRRQPGVELGRGGRFEKAVEIREARGQLLNEPGVAALEIELLVQPLGGPESRIGQHVDLDLAASLPA